MKLLTSAFAFTFSILCFSCLSLSAAETLSCRLLMPDGSPAKDASLRTLKFSDDHAKLPVIVQTYNADPDGRLSFELPEDNFLNCVVLYSPGAAISFHSMPQLIKQIQSQGDIRLTKDIRIEGQAMQRNEPCKDANVRVTQFGFGTYVYLHPALLEALPELQTITDGDGRFSLPAMTLNNYAFRIGGNIRIQKAIDNRPWSGMATFWTDWESDGEDYPWNQLQPKTDVFKVELIKLTALSRISGVVIDRDRGLPLVGAEISANESWHHSTATSDDSGRFELNDVSTAAPRSLTISSPGLPCNLQVNEIALPDENAVDVENLIIQVPTKRRFQAVFKDATNGRAPFVNIAVGFKQSVSLNDAWSAVYEVTHGSLGPEAISSNEGKLDLEIPSGTVELMLGSHNSANSLYHPTSLKVTEDAGLNAPLGISLDRSPGLLVKFDRSETDDNPLRRSREVVVRVQEENIERVYIIDDDMVFLPASNWMQELKINVYATAEDGTRLPVVTDHVVTVKPDLWPYELENR